MLEQTQSHIEQLSFLASKKLLLATSGGLDSMVMAHLFRE
jgi:tRNA(Ile)-lysidine synthase